MVPMEYEGTTCRTLFEWRFVNVLLPTMPAGMFIIMGNASFRRKKVLRQLAQNAGVSVIFLPAYSPDYNPIEKYWAYLKALIHKTIKNFSSLNDALQLVFK